MELPTVMVVCRERSARHLAVAAWAGESPEATYLWPAQFSRLAEVYEERFGNAGEFVFVFAGATDPEKARRPVWSPFRWSKAHRSATTRCQAIAKPVPG